MSRKILIHPTLKRVDAELKLMKRGKLIPLNPNDRLYRYYKNAKKHGFI